MTYKTEGVETVKDPAQRKLHKAFLRYHDPANWKLLHEALVRMGRRDLIGDSPKCLIPATQPEQDYNAPRRKNSGDAHIKRTGKQQARGKRNGQQPKKGAILTQHTGLPPRKQTASNKSSAQRPAAKRAKPSGKSSNKSGSNQNKRRPNGR